MKQLTIFSRIFFLLALILSMVSCSSHIPPEIKTAINNSPDVDQAYNSPDTYLSQKIRWGGVILNTENKENTSWLTILAYPLNDNGKPQISEQSTGRFIAIVDKFLDPVIYKNDRKITVTGQLLKSKTLNVGDFPYQYPVVQIEHYYLWPVEIKYPDVDYPPWWWYDPWYNPYYPHYPIP